MIAKLIALLRSLKKTCQARLNNTHRGQRIALKKVKGKVKYWIIQDPTTGQTIYLPFETDTQQQIEWDYYRWMLR